MTRQEILRAKRFSSNAQGSETRNDSAVKQKTRQGTKFELDLQSVLKSKYLCRKKLLAEEFVGREVQISYLTKLLLSTTVIQSVKYSLVPEKPYGGPNWT